MHRHHFICCFFLFLSQGLDGYGQSIEQIGGKLSATTGNIVAWRPDKNDPVLRINTRDERGLLQKRNLKPLTLTRYTPKKTAVDSVWQQSALRSLKVELPAQQNNTATDQELKSNGAVLVEDIEGQGFSNINPADPTLAVGPNHIVQMINGGNGSALFSIYDKKGKEIIPPSYMDQLPGTSYNGGGDCIAWYDQFTDRYVMTEIGDSAKTGIKINTLIFAVSATNDPTAGWYVYEFYCEDFIPDYPKYGNWNDAWYGVTRDFSDSYLGNSIWAFDKQAMISGKTTVAVQRTRLTDPDNKFGSLCPITLSGKTAAKEGTGALFMYFNDDELTRSTSDKDSIGLIGFAVNFANPLASVVRVEKTFAVAPFASEVCLTRDCASSPAGIGYDVVSNRIMNKPYYRNFGTRQSIVANHTVDINGKGIAGIRWYEISNQGNWQLSQQGTYAPQQNQSCDGIVSKHRFMGSILQNGTGQILLAYNLSSERDFATLAFSGRNTDDPLNTMGFEETIIKKGTGYGTIGSRWGDYNDIVPDPSNDSTFWFTGMYGKEKASWGTSISAVLLRPTAAVDAKLLYINTPTACNTNCSKTINPNIRIQNNGKELLQELTVSVRLNGKLYAEKKWSGSLAAVQEENIALDEVELIEGSNLLQFSISKPNGKEDQRPANDSAAIRVDYSVPQVIPFYENAETANNLPTGWSRATNGSNLLNWSTTDKSAFTGTRSFFIDNFNVNEKNKFADLISPVIEIPTNDSITLDFMLAAAVYNMQSLDTLVIGVSTDCGNNFKTVYTKWGNSLSTKEGLVQTDFYPAVADWRKETIGLRAFGGQQIRIRFRGINNNGNNIFLDKIEINRAVIPPRMKENGYIIVPNPTGGQLTVRFYPEAKNLKEIMVTNQQGQVIKRMQFNTLSPIFTVPIDLSNQPDGVYLLVLLFGDQTKTERIVKINGQIP